MVLRPSIIVLLFAIVATTDARADDAGPTEAAADAPLDAGVAAPDQGAGSGTAAVVEPLPTEPAAEVAPPPEPVIEWDADGDGTLEAPEVELQKRAAEVFADVPAEVIPEALDARPSHKALGVRSLTVARFRAMVQLTRKKVLARLTARIERQSAERMVTVSKVIVVCALSGVLLLFLPLVMARRYPNRFGVLFRYSVLASITFMLTVGLFGAVSLIQRGAQTALARYTNPQLALASGFFDTLDDDAAKLVVVGNELLAPTLVQLQGNTEEQPAVLLLANGRKLVKDAAVFVQVARAFKHVAFVIAMVPTVVLVLSMVLFILAIRPTLVAIVELPAQAASSAGASGDDVFRNSMGRVGAQLRATMCSLGVLVVITMLAGVALGRVIQPALSTLISYFTIAVMYLRFVKDASSVLVMVTLFSVILFLVLNLALSVVATTIFLDKTQRIFQQRFAEKVSLRVHVRFWKWGSIAVLWTLVFPLIYMVVARAGIDLINAQLMDGKPDPTSVNWNLLMLVGPLLLVVGFVVALWASRTFAAVRFLLGYDVKGGSSASVLGVADAAATTFGRP